MKLNFSRSEWFSTGEYELPNTVNDERVYRYEFSWEHPDTKEKITISLKNIGLENFQTFNILQLESKPLNAADPISVVTGVTKITGTAKANEQLNLYFQDKNLLCPCTFFYVFCSSLKSLNLYTPIREK